MNLHPRYSMPDPTRFPGATVWLVDDDPAVLRLLQAMLAEHDWDIRAHGAASEFLAAYEAQDCACLITDLRMPEMDGLDLQRALGERGITLPLIMISGYGEVGAAVTAMRHGAVDFIEKPFDADLLVARIDEALARSAAQSAEREHQAAVAARLAALTPKEREVAGLVVAGSSSRDIAERLGISVRTVENHRANILDKLQAASTVELVNLLR